MIFLSKKHGAGHANGNSNTMPTADKIKNPRFDTARVQANKELGTPSFEMNKISLKATGFRQAGFQAGGQPGHNEPYRQSTSTQVVNC